MKRLSFLLIFAAATLVAISGCGRSGPETIRVHGTVTFDGEPPPAEGMVYFTPVITTSGAIHPGSAPFDEEGQFELTSIGSSEGLVPGSYQVRVECWKVAPSMGEPDKEVSYVGENFVSPTIEVSAEGGDVEVPLDVPLAK